MRINAALTGGLEYFYEVVWGKLNFLRLFSDLHSITFQLCPLEVASLFTFRSIFLRLDSRLVQFISQRFQALLLAVKFSLLGKRLCYDLLCLGMVKTEFCKIFFDTLDSAVDVVGQLQDDSSCGQNSRSAWLYAKRHLADKSTFRRPSCYCLPSR